MKNIFQTSQFKKDFKKVRSRGKDLEKLKSLVMAISTGIHWSRDIMIMR